MRSTHQNTSSSSSRVTIKMTVTMTMLANFDFYGVGAASV
ncbi:unnamed protein product [Dibothriocephalus latus]|uniref:Uncharacterized protein n=1 Tax=Dibothriocephalus latus TaxID=60516 RepID=A0A3P7M9K7_DIBLA|nr:unnamed protein product [Dibothriocephalus latus]